MEKLSTADRLKEIMKSQNLRQVDILEKAQPFCKEYNIKMNKSDLSQYVSGLVEPGQDKLTILGMALGVSEAWLMGYDVPMLPTNTNQKKENFSISQKEQTLLYRYSVLDDKGRHTVDTILEMEYNRCSKIHVVAAHNDNDSPEQLKLMRKDLNEL